MFQFIFRIFWKTKMLTLAFESTFFTLWNDSNFHNKSQTYINFSDLIFGTNKAQFIEILIIYWTLEWWTLNLLLFWIFKYYQQLKQKNKKSISGDVLKQNSTPSPLPVPAPTFAPASAFILSLTFKHYDKLIPWQLYEILLQWIVWLVVHIKYWCLPSHTRTNLFIILLVSIRKLVAATVLWVQRQGVC